MAFNDSSEPLPVADDDTIGKIETTDDDSSQVSSDSESSFVPRRSHRPNKGKLVPELDPLTESRKSHRRTKGKHLDPCKSAFVDSCTDTQEQVSTASESSHAPRRSQRRNKGKLVVAGSDPLTESRKSRRLTKGKHSDRYRS
ncbi:MAG: hypothetical protein ABW185_17130, partial [Sedimenticola sp.]